MANFFDTFQFKKFEKIRDRVIVVNTLKNFEYYVSILSECKRLCESQFNNVGFDKQKKCYRWELDIKKDCAPLSSKYYSEKLQRNIYIALDGSQVLIENGNTFCKVNNKELDILLQKFRKPTQEEGDDKRFYDVLSLKSEFDGVIIS
jgi:hypothetical protein